jgi:Ca-activated chloride channel family protein
MFPKFLRSSHRSLRVSAMACLAIVSMMLAVISIAAGQTPASDSPVMNTPPVSANPIVNPMADPTAANDNPQASAPGVESMPVEPGADDAESTFVFKKDVEEVMLHATVYDGQRNLVPELDKSAFAVFEDGKPQTITSFRRQDVPVAMGIVVDNSGSMRDKREEVNRAVVNLIHASNAADEIFVVNFSQKYYLDQDFTSDAKLLQSALEQVSSAGSTALYDAIIASAVHLSNNPRLDKRVLLVITDGQDNMSQQTLKEASARLQKEKGLTLYAVGLTGGELQESGRQALQQLAQVTGGVAYFPNDLDQVASVTRTIAHDIRSQYIIAYKPQDQSSKPNAKSVKVEAHAAGYKDLVVNTRTGMYNSSNESH